MPVRMTWFPRIRMTKDELTRLEKHVRNVAKIHPSTNISNWVREAVELKMRVDAQSDTTVLETAKRLANGKR